MTLDFSSKSEIPTGGRPRPLHVILAVAVIVVSIMLSTALTLTEDRHLGKPITAESFPNTEIIQLDTHSAYVSNISVDLQFPENYSLQLSAPSQLELYGEKQGLLAIYPIKTELSQISLNRILVPRNVYFKLKLYYCRKTEQALCLIKNVVFQVPIIRSKAPGDLNIRYRVPAAEDVAKFD